MTSIDFLDEMVVDIDLKANGKTRCPLQVLFHHPVWHVNKNVHEGLPIL